MKLRNTIERVRDVCRVRQLSLATERTYVGWISRYASDVPKMPATWGSERKMEAWLTRLAHRGVSKSTQSQAFNALLFLYRDVLKVKLGEVNSLRPKRPVQVRHAPSREDVMAMIHAARDRQGYPTVLVVKLLYGCGLRVSEPLNLRVKDVDVAHSRLVIRGAKGGKDRVVPVPCSLMAELVAQMKRARVSFEDDVRQGIPLEVPGLMARKYPKAPFSWSWAWVFPAKRWCLHPRSGERVKYRMHEVNVQRCVQEAVARAGLATVLTPHHLRHAFATHVLDRGVNIRDLQAVLGHVSLETTMGYTHAEASRVISPLESGH